MSEIMNIIIAFHISHHRDFKNVYTGYTARFFKSEFPHLLSYTRFLEVMPSAVVPLCRYFASLKNEATGIEFIDSISQIEHTRHRSVHGFMLNIIGGLVAYQLKEEATT